MYTGPDLQLYEVGPTTYVEMNDRYAGWQNSPPGTPYWFITEALNSITIFPAPSVSSLVFNYSDLVVSGSSQFQVSSAGQRAFVSTDVGYVILVMGGTGFNTGRFTILSVTAGVATVDQPVGIVSSTSGVADLTTGGLLLRGLALPSYNWTSLSQVNPMALPAHRATMWRACLLRLNQFPTKDNMLREERLEKEYAKAKSQVSRAVTQWTPATRRGVRRKTPFGGGYFNFLLGTLLIQHVAKIFFG